MEALIVFGYLVVPCAVAGVGGAFVARAVQRILDAA